MPQTTVEDTFTCTMAPRTATRATLHKRRYTSDSALQAEWQGIWTRCWLFSGLVSDLADSGDYFVYQIGRESVVILKDERGDIRAFYNVCQHRGNRIFTSESGSIQQVACPYHGWQYGLDGVLREIPDEQRFCPEVDRSQRSLKPVKLAVWAGLIWINMDPDAAPLEDYLGSIIGNLKPYHFEKMVLAKHQTVKLDANWKTVRDNFLEQYHVDFIHPQHASFVDCCNSENILWPYGHSATMVEGFTTNSRYPVPENTPEHLVMLLTSLGMDPADFNGRVPDIRRAVQVRKRELGAELGFDYAEFSDSQISDVWQYDIFPNTFMTITAEEVWIYGPRPHATNPDCCYFDKWTISIPKELSTDLKRQLSLNPRVVASVSDERPEHEVFSAADVIAGTHSLTITLDQDIHYLGDMQAGMHSRGFEHAVLNEDEVRLQHFHDWVEYYINQC